MQVDYSDPFAAQQAQAQATLLRAQQAQAQSQMPKGQMAGRVFVGAHPMEHLAEVLRQRSAGMDETAAMKQLQGIGQQRQEAQGRDMSAFVQALRGTPAQPEFQAAGPAPQGAPQEGGYTVPAQAAKAGDPMGAYSMAASSQSPMVRQMGMQGMAQLPQLEQAKAEKEANRAWQAEQKELDRQARQDQIRMQLDAQRQMKEFMAANKPERQAQIIDTDQGKMRVMPNGTLAPLMDMSGNAISGPKGPQGTLARQNEAQQALNAITQAESILPKATSSGLGSLVDSAAGFVGYSTPGAQAASQLKAVEGELVSKMPKMSGPQSDKDVALYKQMAGVVGDETKPVATRQAALQTVKEIQQRYAGPQVNLGATGNPNSVMSNSGGGNRIRFDAQGNIIP